MATFDVYIRISKEGDRTPEQVEEQLDIYEKSCRQLADREGVEVDLVVRESDVKGSTAVEERGLERLLKRVENGESAGIIVPNAERFARDVIEGALAYRRIKLAGGRLVGVDGGDSARPGDQLMFNVKMAFAEDYLARSRENFVARQEKAAGRGVYLAARVPVGLVRGGKGQKVEINDALRPMVVELFEMRATGAGFPELIRHAQAAYGVKLSKSGVRWLIRNRAYVGEMTVQTARKGETRVVKGAFPAILTEAQWQAAQVGPGTFFPRNGISLEASLRGLVYCATCGRRCKVGISGKPGSRKPSYVCTGPGECPRRVSMTADRLDAYVTNILRAAIADRVPEVAAIMEGEAAYMDALAAVTDAQALLEQFRDDLDIQRELGTESWKAGLDVRKQNLTTARAAMNKLKPAAAKESKAKQEARTFEEYAEADAAEVYPRFIARVVLKPSSVKGASDPVSTRAEVWLVGAEKPSPTPVYDPKVTEIMEAAKRAAEMAA